MPASIVPVVVSAAKHVVAGDIKSALESAAIAYWKLDESSGNAIDSSPNGLTATEVNGVETETMAIGPARLLNGTNDRFNITDAATDGKLDLNHDFTIDGFITPDTLGTLEHLVSKYNNGASSSAWRVYAHSGNSFAFSTSNDSTYDANSQVQITDAGIVNALTYFCATFQAGTESEGEAGNGTINLSINNGTPVTKSTEQTPKPNTQPVYIGARSDLAASEHWDGSIQHLGIYARPDCLALRQRQLFVLMRAIAIRSLTTWSLAPCGRA